MKSSIIDVSDKIECCISSNNPSEKYSNLMVETGDMQDKIRSDLDSECIKKTYPNLPYTLEWSKHHEYVLLRNKYLHNKDMEAYNKIKRKYPNLKPPNILNK